MSKKLNYRRNLWIPPMEWEMVVGEAKRLGISRAEVIRRIINKYFGTK